MKIGYFSMEVGLSEHIPTYSGGLGILAGDHIKSAADLNIPLMAVTVLYKAATSSKASIPRPAGGVVPLFRSAGFHGAASLQSDHQDRESRCARGGLEIQPDRHSGQSSHLLPGYGPSLNTPEDRLITQFLYGGDEHTRICQEAVLGIGGYLALKKLERGITTYHMNEGHAVFLTLALLSDSNGNEEAVREKCIFTTHTPVPAGHDKFSYDVAPPILGAYLPSNIRALAGPDELNTTILALSLSRASNGVSELHGDISRQMFPGFNIGHITNGVHHLSWTGPEFQALFDDSHPQLAAATSGLERSTQHTR